MPDYKDLFYKSQAEIADAIEMLDAMKQQLLECMQYCEDGILDDEDGENNKES